MTAYIDPDNSFKVYVPYDEPDRRSRWKYVAMTGITALGGLTSWQVTPKEERQKPMHIALPQSTLNSRYYITQPQHQSSFFTGRKTTYRFSPPNPNHLYGREMGPVRKWQTGGVLYKGTDNDAARDRVSKYEL